MVKNTMPSRPVNDPTGPNSDKFRVIRDSSWGDEQHLARSASRKYDEVLGLDLDTGFRVAMTQ